LFDGYDISFDASLVTYINSTNIPPITIINRIYERQNLPSLYLFSFVVGLRTYQHPCTYVNFCRTSSLDYIHVQITKCQQVGTWRTVHIDQILDGREETKFPI
jgi:hypothetical protein